MLSDIVDLLKGDSELTALLGEAEWGGPAVFTIWAPDSKARPYITLRFDENQDSDNRAYSSGDLVLDVWDSGTSHTDLEPIRDALHALLDRRIIDTNRGPVRFLWASDAPEQEDEPQWVRWRLVYTLRRAMTEQITT